MFFGILLIDGEDTARSFESPSAVAIARSHTLSYRFQSLGIGATLHDGKDWHSIATSEHVSTFEFGHGKDMERYAYNQRCMTRAFERGKSVLAEHAGFWDLFVPVPGLRGHLLITGPFARARPTGADILTRWRWITGRQGHPSDPEFAHYLSVTLGTLTLDERLLAHYQRFVESYAALLSGHGGAALVARAVASANEADHARAVDATWGAAREMVDETSAAAWRSPQMREAREKRGIARLPEHVLVGLLEPRERELDPVEKVLQQNAFQRACVAWGRELGVIVGRVGDHGVVLLVTGQRSPARTRRALEHLATRFTSYALRRFGFSVHLGASAPDARAPLGECYRQALGAAEGALSRGQRLVIAEPGQARSLAPLRQLRAELAAATEPEPRTLAARFERYIDAVNWAAGYRMDLVQAHLEAGLDQVARVLLLSGALSPKDYQAMCDELERVARRAATVKELVLSYRAAMVDLAESSRRPVPASQERSLRRALAFVDAHFAEPLEVRQVARIAGFAPAYFGQLFKRNQGTSFQLYVRARRVEHAKRLLTSTPLTTARVAHLSGFVERHYFYRAFKAVTGVTPKAYRDSAKSLDSSGARLERDL